MFVVTLPSSAAAHPRAFALKARRAGADVLELRGDLTPTLASFVSPLPLLLSPRGQGTAFLRRFNGSYVDLDYSEQNLLPAIPQSMKVIRSMHDHKKTPNVAAIKKIVQKMYTKNVWMIKISTLIHNERDILQLFRIRDFLNKKSIRSSVLGMGEKAHLLRLFSPLEDAFTYTFLDGFEPSAPSQLPLSFYRFTEGRKKPKLFGIIGGSQIVASKSPLLHNALFQRHGIDALYSCFPTSDFGKTMRFLRSIGIAGLSVTAPFKKKAFLMAKNCDAVTQSIGVANTLVLTPTPHPSPEGGGECRQGLLPPSGEGLRMGVGDWNSFNTDVFGFEEGYPELRKAKTIAILGAGGVVPAVIFAMCRINPKAAITVFARDVKKAKIHLRNVETQNFASLHIQNLHDASSFAADAVICAISEDVKLPTPKRASRTSVAIDLRYGKTTAFMRDAAKQGYRVRDGIPMLISQAIRQFEYWTGRVATKSDVGFLRKLLRPS